MKYTIRTFIQSPKVAKECEEPSGKVIVRVRWNNKRNEVGLYVGAYANPIFWDAENQMPKRQTTHKHNGEAFRASLIREKINVCIDAVDAAFEHFDEEHKCPSNGEFKEQYYNELGLEAREIAKRKLTAKETISSVDRMRLSANLFDCLDAYMEEQMASGMWSEQTKKKYVTISNKLKEFDSGLTFDSLTYDTMIQFQSHLVTCGYCNSTTREVIKKFLTFLRRCSMGKNPIACIDKDVLDYECKLKDCGRTIKFLTADEFNRLYHCRFPSERQTWQRARDLFSFMVATGLRVSDLKELKRQNITNGCITLVAEKTDKVTTIPLNDISKAIIKKYEEVHFRDDLLLPIMSEQKINKYLKEAAEWAEITDTFSTSYKCGGQRIDEEFRKCDKISCHWARRTFVSLCLASGATMTEVRAITGHSSESAIKPYVGITMEERERATSMLDAVVKPKKGKRKRMKKADILSKLGEKLTAEQLQQLLEEVV